MKDLIYVLMFLSLIGLFIYMLYISAMRTGRDSKGKFTKQRKSPFLKKQKVQLFYSELRGGAN